MHRARLKHRLGHIRLGIQFPGAGRTALHLRGNGFPQRCGLHRHRRLRPVDRGLARHLCRHVAQHQLHIHRQFFDRRAAILHRQRKSLHAHVHRQRRRQRHRRRRAHELRESRGAHHQLDLIFLPAVQHHGIGLHQSADPAVEVRGLDRQQRLALLVCIQRSFHPDQLQRVAQQRHQLAFLQRQRIGQSHGELRQLTLCRHCACIQHGLGHRNLHIQLPGRGRAAQYGHVHGLAQRRRLGRNRRLGPVDRRFSGDLRGDIAQHKIRIQRQLVGHRAAIFHRQIQRLNDQIHRQRLLECHRRRRPAELCKRRGAHHQADGVFLIGGQRHAVGFDVRMHAAVEVAGFDLQRGAALLIRIERRLHPDQFQLLAQQANQLPFLGRQCIHHVDGDVVHLQVQPDHRGRRQRPRRRQKVHPACGGRSTRQRDLGFLFQRFGNIHHQPGALPLKLPDVVRRNVQHRIRRRQHRCKFQLIDVHRPARHRQRKRVQLQNDIDVLLQRRRSLVLLQNVVDRAFAKRKLHIVGAFAQRKAVALLGNGDIHSQRFGIGPERRLPFLLGDVRFEGDIQFLAQHGNQQPVLVRQRIGHRHRQFAHVHRAHHLRRLRRKIACGRNQTVHSQIRAQQALVRAVGRITAELQAQFAQVLGVDRQRRHIHRRRLRRKTLGRHRQGIHLDHPARPDDLRRPARTARRTRARRTRARRLWRKRSGDVCRPIRVLHHVQLRLVDRDRAQVIGHVQKRSRADRRHIDLRHRRHHLA